VVFELIKTSLVDAGTVPKLQFVAVDQYPPDAPVKMLVVCAGEVVTKARNAAAARMRDWYFMGVRFGGEDSEDKDVHLWN